MKKIKVSVETEIEIEFDENSLEFKELFEAYKEVIDNDGDYNTMAEHICYNVARLGVDEFIEGIGNTKINGNQQYKIKSGNKEFINHPINMIVSTNCGLVDFETYVDEM